MLLIHIFRKEVASDRRFRNCIGEYGPWLKGHRIQLRKVRMPVIEVCHTRRKSVRHEIEYR